MSEDYSGTQYEFSGGAGGQRVFQLYENDSQIQQQVRQIQEL